MRQSEESVKLIVENSWSLIALFSNPSLMEVIEQNNIQYVRYVLIRLTH
jgi:hypothetical protein